MTHKSGAWSLRCLDRCICFGVAPFLQYFCGPDGGGRELYIILLLFASRKIPHGLPGFVLFSLDPRCWLHGGIIKDGGRRLAGRLDAHGPTGRHREGGLGLPLASFSSFFSLTNVDDYDDVEIYDLANTIISKSPTIYFTLSLAEAVRGQMGLMSYVILI